MQLAEIADQLYGLLPQDFTAARDAAAREARSTGARELAAHVKQLRRPSVSAWAVNLLARARREPLDDLLALGAELREAQAALAGDELRALSRQRHRVIASLADQARSLVNEAGQQLADAAAREVGATLEAGLADPAAAAAIRSGRLMRPLTSTGLEPVDLVGAVAAPDDIEALPGFAPRARNAPPAKSPDRNARLADARKQVGDARAAVEQAEQRLAAAEESLVSAGHAAEDAQTRIAELTEALAQAKADRSAADSDGRRAETSRDEARRDHQSARRAADRAQQALDRLSK